MLFTIALTALATAFSFTNAAPTPSPVPQRLTVRAEGDNLVPNSFIVKLKSGADRSRHILGLPFAFSVEDAASPITHSFFSDIFNGYSGTFVGADLDAILSSPDVEYVEQEHYYYTSDIQVNAPWGLQSISTQAKVGGDAASMGYTYSYSQPAGDGVDIYIVDTGINASHEEFEGRASFPYAAGTMQRIDGHGHGTHCAGTAAGKTYGVAKKANIIGVKVLADNGQGTTSNIVEGLGFVLNNTLATGRPSIASMSLGGDASDVLDEAVNKCLSNGIAVIAAAGNSAKDANGQSPGRVPNVITVGASDINNAMASFSNFGSVVDIFAPGVDIVSAWFTGPSATKKLSGTSMAAPHVAGLAAYFLSQDNSIKPDAMQAKIIALATKNAVTGTPSGTTNILAFNGGILGGGGSGNTGENKNPISSWFSTCPSFWPNCPWGKN